MRLDHSTPKPRLQLPALPEAWQPLTPTEFMAAGTGNDHWLLHTQAGALVWRQFGQAPGSSHPREARLLQQLQPFDWVPRLLLACPQGLLMQRAPGQHPTATTLNADQRQQLLQLLLQLWQHPCNLPAQDYRQLLQDYWQTGGSQPALAPLLQRLDDEAARWPASSLRLTHHDLHGGNLLLDDHRWTLLDWEYAAPGNPWLDAVSLHRFLPLTLAEKHQLQAVLPDLGHTDPWSVMQDWLSGLDQLWHQARQPD